VRAYCWYLGVALLFLPKLLSHEQDGTRKDYRAAAEWITQHASPDEPVFTNMQTTLWYYLPDAKVGGWPGGQDLPQRSFFVVLAGHAWEAPLTIPGRHLELLAAFGKRRYDEQSFRVWIYHVAAPCSDPSP
jgi:hypothetical protein